jgi:hypothetical protein
MTQAFRSSLREARRNIYSTLHPRQALPILTALLEVEMEHDRHVSLLNEARQREASCQGAVVPALRLLLAVVELADQPAGVEEERYQAAIAAAGAVLDAALDAQHSTPRHREAAGSRRRVSPAAPAFNYL